MNVTFIGDKRLDQLFSYVVTLIEECKNENER